MLRNEKPVYVVTQEGDIKRLAIGLEAEDKSH